MNRSQLDHGSSREGAPWIVLGGFWAMVFLSVFATSAPWAGFHAVMLLMAGSLAVAFPPKNKIPKSWWICTAVFLIASCAAFLPLAWFQKPAWRMELETLGVHTGNLVVIQARQAAEGLALFSGVILGGIWLAGHRPSAAQRSVLALAFVAGVALYALISKFYQDILPVNKGGVGHFGFFPNRNHTATYLAMGAVCGFGVILQSFRAKQSLNLCIAVVSTGICIWACFSWSISRGGLVLVTIGGPLWLGLLGKRYLGNQGMRITALALIATTGAFFITENPVKERLSETVGKAATLYQTPEATGDETTAIADKTKEPAYLDFRVPTALDTLPLIKDNALTGIGVGQFRSIFPQYRNKTAAVNDSESYHPESDWLWLAAENGIIATAALAALTVLAFRKSILSIITGHERALRASCLVAAMLVPLHGIFDVPGHRLSLAWASALLFTLSLGSTGETMSSNKSKLACRTMGVAIMGLGCFLASMQWLSSTGPATTLGDRAYDKAMTLYQEDLKDQITTTPKQENAPDKLEAAQQIVKNALNESPLNSRLWHANGFLALHFEGEEALVDQSFAIERQLDPTWIKAPLTQAKAWSKTDRQRTRSLWTIALERSKRLAEKNPDTAFSPNDTLKRIGMSVSKDPELKAIYQELSIIYQK